MADGRKPFGTNPSSVEEKSKGPLKGRCRIFGAICEQCCGPGLIDLSQVLRLRGSVIPRAAVHALPSAALAVFLHVALRHFEWEPAGTFTIGKETWTGFNFVLGVLIIFRTNQAYARYWEGAALLQQARGEWFNATSSLMAFCTNDPQKQKEVECFQNLIVRLVSMLYCAGLQQVAMVADDKLEILDNSGIDYESLIFLQDCPHRVEVVLQWIQKLVVEAASTGIVTIPPPILSRVFQELSRGIVNIHNVRKIAEIPFPFPYTQMIMVLLLVHAVATPVLASLTNGSAWIAGSLTFIIVLAFWSMNYIAAEIEQPFGEDFNDLPITAMLMDMNGSLLTLLHKQTQQPPKFSYDTSQQVISRVTCQDAHYTSIKRMVSGFTQFNRKSTIAAQSDTRDFVEPFGRPSVSSGTPGIHESAALQAGSRLNIRHRSGMGEIFPSHSWTSADTPVSSNPVMLHVSHAVIEGESDHPAPDARQPVPGARGAGDGRQEHEAPDVRSWPSQNDVSEERHMSPTPPSATKRGGRAAAATDLQRVI